MNILIYVITLAMTSSSFCDMQWCLHFIFFTSWKYEGADDENIHSFCFQYSVFTKSRHVLSNNVEAVYLHN